MIEWMDAIGAENMMLLTAIEGCSILRGNPALPVLDAAMQHDDACRHLC